LFDPAFGTAGKVMSITPYVSNVVLQADGKILIAGGGGVFRYNVDGSLDTVLGSGVNFYFSLDYLALEPDGKLVSFGSRHFGPPVFGTANGLQRLNPDATIDTSFGQNGHVTINSSSVLYGASHVIQPDGKIDLIQYSGG